MAEVLTRSLITGMSTVFLVTVLYIFGGTTLKDFAFAMMIGVLSGAYSSIFIASPVLTHWKEREPAYRSRRARLMEAMGRVPTFPEENVVAKVDESDGAGEPPAPARRPKPARAARASTATKPAPPAVEPAVEESPNGEAEADGGDGVIEPPIEAATPSTPATPRPSRAEREKRRRQQRSRRKHGRRR
jgi:SecD/SecF fusion protein